MTFSKAFISLNSVRVWISVPSPASSPIDANSFCKLPRLIISIRSASNSAIFALACLNFLYSKILSINSCRGSISLPASSNSFLGMSILALMRIKVLTKSMNSLLNSIFRFFESFIKCKKSFVILVILILYISNSSRSIKNKSKSKGPSN